MDALEQARRYLAAIPGAVSGGGGHAQTFKAASCLVNGYSLGEADALALLTEYNSRCQPPWNERELAHKIKSAMTAGHDKPRGHLLRGTTSSHSRRSQSTPMPAKAAPKPVVKRYDVVKSKLPEPMADGTRKLLMAVFREGEGIRIVPAKLNDDGGEIPAGNGPVLSREGWIAKLDKYKGNPNGIFKSDDKTGIYIGLNPLKVGSVPEDANVTDFRHVLIEFDDAPLEEQWGLYQAANIPCAAIILSGGKSVHAWVKVDARDRAEYNERVAILWQHFEAYGLDTKNKNPARLSRLPNCERFSKRQELLALNVGAPSWDEWLGSLVESTLPEIIDVVDFMATDIPEPKHVIHGILHQGSKLALGGGSKSYKTWTLLDLAMSVVTGKPWLSFPTTQGRVLFVNFELHNFDWQKRIQHVAKCRQIEFQREGLDLLNLRGFAASYETLIPQLISQLKNRKYLLVVFDPTYKMYGTADENSASDISNLLNSFERFCVHSGSALAFGAHFSKGNQSGKSSIDRISGSGVFARDPDSIVTLTDHKEEKHYILNATLRSFPPIEPFVIKWEFPVMVIAPEMNSDDLKKPKGQTPSCSDEDVKNLLPETGLMSEDWEKLAFEKLGIKTRTFNGIRARLNKSESVIQSKINNRWKPCKKQNQEAETEIVEPF